MFFHKQIIHLNTYVAATIRKIINKSELFSTNFQKFLFLPSNILRIETNQDNIL